MIRRSFKSASLVVLTLATASPAWGAFDPQVGQPGSLGIAKTSSAFVGWASSVVSFDPGPQDITNPGGPKAATGVASNALGNTSNVVSLGDGGSITLGFATPITDGAGADFAVFENGFGSGSAGLAYLELAFVEVSSDGVNFFRFAATSLTPTTTQVGSFGLIDASNLNNLAGKYISGYGTGFDLAELAGVSPLLDINRVTQVRLIDVVGSIDPAYGSYDAFGNLVNDPYKTAFSSGGFDLNGVGVINAAAAVPEPASLALVASGLGFLGLVARGRRARSGVTAGDVRRG